MPYPIAMEEGVHDRGSDTVDLRPIDASVVQNFNNLHWKVRFRFSNQVLFDVVGVIDVISESFRKQACQLFRSTQDEDLLCGRSIKVIAAVSVYETC